jgi:hypothetical protein
MEPVTSIVLLLVMAAFLDFINPSKQKSKDEKTAEQELGNALAKYLANIQVKLKE